MSAQGAAEQREFAEREHIPYPLLSDSALRLAAALRLPTFEVAGMRPDKKMVSWSMRKVSRWTGPATCG